MADICCICLDPPKKANPLYHLSCGCNVALFHKSCENEWIHSLTAFTPIKCLVCKRDPVLKNNYSLSYHTGENQKFLWQCMGVFCLELPIGIHFKSWVIGAEGASFLLFPFVFPCTQPHIFYVLHYIFNMSLYLLLAFITDFEISAQTLIIIRSVHLITMFFSINCKNSVNPLLSYVISRDITYTRIIYLPKSDVSKTESPKPVSKSLKGNKRVRRRIIR